MRIRKAKGSLCEELTRAISFRITARARSRPIGKPRDAKEEATTDGNEFCPLTWHEARSFLPCRAISPAPRRGFFWRPRFRDARPRADASAEIGRFGHVGLFIYENQTRSPCPTFSYANTVRRGSTLAQTRALSART